MWCTYMYSGKHTHKRTIGHLSFLSSYNFLHLDNTPLSSWKQCRLAQDDTTPGKPLTLPSWSWTSLRFSWPLVPSVTWLHLCLCDLPQLPVVKVMYPRCLWHPEWPTMPLSPQLQNSFLTPQSSMTSEQGHLFQCLHLACSCSILLSAEPPSCSHLHLTQQPLPPSTTWIPMLFEGDCSCYT